MSRSFYNVTKARTYVTVELFPGDKLEALTL
jgi:hypothetical protein